MPKSPDKPAHDPMAGEVERLLRQLRPKPAAVPVTMPGAPAGARRPPAGTAGAAPPRAAAGTSSHPDARAPTPRFRPLPSPLAVWGRVALGALLAISLTQWPYPTCGLGLAGYLSGAAMVLVTGVWAGHGSWRARRGFAHTLAILLLFAAVALSAWQVLPRVGWAPVAQEWRCPG